MWSPISLADACVLAPRDAGCMAALQAEHFLAAHEALQDRTAERATAEDDVKTARAVAATEAPGSTQGAALANGVHAPENAAREPVPA